MAHIRVSEFQTLNPNHFLNTLRRGRNAGGNLYERVKEVMYIHEP